MSHTNSNPPPAREGEEMVEGDLPPVSINEILAQPVTIENRGPQANPENMTNPLTANVAGAVQLSVNDNELHKKLMRRLKLEDEENRFCCGILDKRDNFCVHIVKLIFAIIIFPFIFLCKSCELFLDVCLDPCCIKIDNIVNHIGEKISNCLHYISRKTKKCIKKCCSCYKQSCHTVCRPMAVGCDYFLIGIDRVLTCIGNTALTIIRKTAKKIKPCTDALASCTRAIYNKISKYVGCICSRFKMVCDAIMELIEKLGHLILKVALRIKTHVVTPILKFLKAVGRWVMKYFIYPIVKLLVKIGRFAKNKVIKPTYDGLAKCLKGKRFALKEDPTLDESQQIINQP